MITLPKRAHVYDETAEYTSASICHNDPNFCDLPGCPSCRPETYRGAHRAHRHPYIVVYDSMSVSRAKCPSGVDAFSCRTAHCPKHEPVAYAAHNMARRATDSFGLPFAQSIDWTDEPEF